MRWYFVLRLLHRVTSDERSFRGCSSTVPAGRTPGRRTVLPVQQEPPPPGPGYRSSQPVENASSRGTSTRPCTGRDAELVNRCSPGERLVRSKQFQDGRLLVPAGTVRHALSTRQATRCHTAQPLSHMPPIYLSEVDP